MEASSAAKEVIHFWFSWGRGLGVGYPFWMAEELPSDLSFFLLLHATSSSDVIVTCYAVSHPFCRCTCHHFATLLGSALSILPYSSQCSLSSAQEYPSLSQNNSNSSNRFYNCTNYQQTCWNQVIPVKHGVSTPTAFSLKAFQGTRCHVWRISCRQLCPARWPSTWSNMATCQGNKCWHRKQGQVLPHL